MPAREWTLQRGYASVIYPSKGASEPQPPNTYALRTDAAFRQALSVATEIAGRRPMTSIVLNMDDNRVHPVREAMLKLAFGQTRTPLPAMVELALRLATATDKRTRPALFVVTIEENVDARRASMYVFPEESTYTLKSSAQEPTSRPSSNTSTPSFLSRACGRSRDSRGRTSKLILSTVR